MVEPPTTHATISPERLAEMTAQHDALAAELLSSPEARLAYHRAAVERGRRAALIAAYWRLRDHADALRDTSGYQRLAELYDNCRDDEQQMRQYLLLKARYDGIDDGARDLAEMLGVPEYEIERPTVNEELTVAEVDHA